VNRSWPSPSHRSIPDRHGDLDLHRPTPWKGGHTDGRTSVAAGIPEHIEEDGTGTVHHGRLLVEVRCRRYETGDGEHALHPVERAQLDLEDSESVESADGGSGRPLLDGDVDPEGADAGQLTLDPRELPRRPGDPVVHDDGVQRIVRRMGTVQGQTQFTQSGTDPSLDAGHQRAHPDAVIPDGFGQVM
jgi:hypothetical protein